VSLKIGALFAGYGGLDMAVMDVLDTELAWYAEFDKAPAKVMAHHHPDVPNLWDVTKVDWSAVEPVDVITGGSPCQDLSHAGKRKGMKAGTRSGLWASMCDAIDIIRPRLVVWENVKGALSAEASSALEQCPRCVGDPRDRGPVLRALGRVVGDLADIGYVGRVYGLRAADVGGAHGRFRVFLCASPEDAAGLGELTRPASPLPQLGRGSTVRPVGSDRSTLPARLAGQLTLLPTPAVNDMGASYTPDEWDAWTDRMKSEHGNGNGHGKSLSIEAKRLNGADSGWLQYEAAIRRAESVTGRPAPPPTKPGDLSPAFVEWLMMLPAGHVTDPVIGISERQQLKALGNGVVPPQAAAALRAYIADERAEASA